MSSYNCPGDNSPPLSYTGPPWARTSNKRRVANGHPPLEYGGYGVCSYCGKAVKIKVNGMLRGHAPSRLGLEKEQARRARHERLDATAVTRIADDLTKLLRSLK